MRDPRRPDSLEVVAQMDSACAPVSLHELRADLPRAGRRAAQGGCLGQEVPGAELNAEFVRACDPQREGSDAQIRPCAPGAARAAPRPLPAFPRLPKVPPAWTGCAAPSAAG